MATNRSDTLYKVVKEDLKHQIRSGQLKVGDRLYSEQELCNVYDISRISAKRALNELKMEGYISREVGRGSFVTYAPIEHLLLGLYSLTNEVAKRGMVPSFKLLEFHEYSIAELALSDSIELKQKLFLKDHDRVYFVKRLRYADGDIMALDCTYVPVKFCPSITEEEILKVGSLYSVMERKFGCAPSRAQEYFYARAVPPDVAKLLEVVIGSPSLVVQRIGYSSGNPVEFNYRFYKGDKYHYRIDLQKIPGNE